MIHSEVIISFIIKVITRFSAATSYLKHVIGISNSIGVQQTHNLLKKPLPMQTNLQKKMLIKNLC